MGQSIAPITIELGVMSIILGLVTALPVGIYSSLNVHALDGCAGITQVRVATARRPSFQHLMV